MTTPRQKNTKAPFHPRLADMDIDLLGKGENDLFVQENIIAWESDYDTKEVQGLIFPSDKVETFRDEEIGHLFDLPEEPNQ